MTRRIWRRYVAARSLNHLGRRRIRASYGSPERHGFDDSVTKRGINNRFTNVLYDLSRRGIAAKLGHGPAARWGVLYHMSGLIYLVSGAAFWTMLVCVLVILLTRAGQPVGRMRDGNRIMSAFQPSGGRSGGEGARHERER